MTDIDTDRDAVLALAQGMTDAWNAGDGGAYGELFTEDATYIAFNGMRMNGRGEIAATHAWLFEGPLKGTKLGASAQGGDGVEVRFLTPDVAHVISAGGMAMAADGPADPGHDSLVTLVAVRTPEGWRFAAFQNTRRQAPPAA